MACAFDQFNFRQQLFMQVTQDLNRGITVDPFYRLGLGKTFTFARLKKVHFIIV